MKLKNFYGAIVLTVCTAVLVGCGSDREDGGVYVPEHLEQGDTETAPVSSPEMDDETSQEDLATDRPDVPEESLDQETIEQLNNELHAYAEKHGAEWTGPANSSLFVPGIRNEIKLDTGLLDNLSQLSSDALRLIGSISVRYLDIQVVPELPDDLSLQQLSFNKRIEDISSLAGTNVQHLSIPDSNISSIDVLSENQYIETLHIGKTKVDALPNMSGMNSLKVLRLDGTPIRSLENIDTIPNDFELNLFMTPELENIDALLESNIETLYIDSTKNTRIGPSIGTYERFEEWFDKSLETLKTRNSDFELRFNLPTGP
ncbi:hypothetical protein [Salinispira pacifica]|uniref:Uncharacterized protein n=1 Tax=Salinispira pacifica TaxID=1307761 RepID=V5WF09_9SPIO|nr:hypothetical protein [Salinispira pacifica]AHC14387.1 hypothetical protein L21SP2_0967 [Salinispira pacifica]